MNQILFFSPFILLLFVLTLTNTIGSGLPKVRQNSIAQVTRTALVLTSSSHDADANLTTRMERSVLTPGIKFIKLYIPVLELTERNVTRYSLTDSETEQTNCSLRNNYLKNIFSYSGGTF